MVVMAMKVCCGFGHRTLLANIEDSLLSTVLKAVEDGCEIFYTGAMGDFDALFSASVRKAKARLPHIKLICVKPYFSNDVNTNKEYYAELYDDIIIPPEIIGIHYKAAIKARNRWMVDNSDLIICYIIRNYGGAADAVKYARHKEKRIINPAD